MGGGGVLSSWGAGRSDRENRSTAHFRRLLTARGRALWRMLGRWPALLGEPHQIALPAIPRRTLDLEAAAERLREEREEVRSRLEN